MLKSLAKKPKISDYHVPGVRSFYILLSNDAFLDFLLIYALLSQSFYVEIYALFRRFFVTETQTPQTFLLLECTILRSELLNVSVSQGLLAQE